MAKSRAYRYWTGDINKVGSSEVEYVNTLHGFNCPQCGHRIVGRQEHSVPIDRELANVTAEILWFQEQLKEATENLVRILKSDS